MTNRRLLAVVIPWCAVGAVLFTACGSSGSGGTAGSGGYGGGTGVAAVTLGNGGTNAGGGGEEAGQAGLGGNSGQAIPNGNGGLGGASVATGGGGNGGAVGTPPSTFTCGDLGALDADATTRTCFDFSDPAQAASWMPDAGTWTTVNGQYVGTGPSAPLTCIDTGSLMTASLVDGFSASDVRLHVQMTSVDRADKVIVLRSQDSGNRIELNFVAYWDDGGTPAGGALVIQQLVNCQQSFLVPVNTISVPHNIGDTLTVDLELRGSHLAVSVGGSPVFDGALAFPTGPGNVGLAVITGETVHFDDFWVEALD